MNLHNFKTTDINGNEFDFSQLAGKKVLIVNTASECGYTPHFAQLEELHKEFGGETFEVIGFPSNDFGAQDPGTDAEIATFCQVNYGVTFPMMSKVTILGEKAHPIYKWLQAESGTAVKWNFQKFLIDEKGDFVKVIAHNVSPIDEEIVTWVKGI
jgi:glutathione peroxidase